MTYIYIMSRPFENMPRSLKDGDAAELQSITFPDGTTQDTAFTGGGSAFVGGRYTLSSSSGAANNEFKFPVTDYEENSPYDTSTGRFTIATAGKYCFYMYLLMTPNNVGTFSFHLLELASGQSPPSGTTRMRLQGTMPNSPDFNSLMYGILDCAVGDVFYIKNLLTINGALIPGTTSGCYMGVYKVSD